MEKFQLCDQMCLNLKDTQLHFKDMGLRSVDQLHGSCL